MPPASASPDPQQPAPPLQWWQRPMLWVLVLLLLCSLSLGLWRWGVVPDPWRGLPAYPQQAPPARSAPAAELQLSVASRWANDPGGRRAADGQHLVWLVHPRLDGPGGWQPTLASAGLQSYRRQVDGCAIGEMMRIVVSDSPPIVEQAQGYPTSVRLAGEVSPPRSLTGGRYRISLQGYPGEKHVYGAWWREGNEMPITYRSVFRLPDQRWLWLWLQSRPENSVRCQSASQKVHQRFSQDLLRRAQVRMQ